MDNQNKNFSRPGYEYLAAYQLGKVIQDLTVEFCDRFVDKKSRTHDQMVQAARSNPQNVAEGFTAESLKSYLFLAGVARGSNEELAKDFQDFLRQRNLEIWEKNHPKVLEFRKFRAQWVPPTSLNTPTLPNDPEQAANMLLTFCQMDGFLLGKLTESLKKKHETEGGLTEKLYRKRIAFRNSQNPPTPSNPQKSPTPLKSLILSLTILGCFTLASSASADYYAEGTMKSENMLSGATVTAITGFDAAVSLPASTSASVSFSQDRVNFYSSANVEGGWDALSDGANSLDISGLNWSGGSLFYKLKLETTDPLATPAVSEVEITYDGEEVPPAGNAHYFEGRLLSTDLLSASGGELSGSDYFGYAISSLPYGTFAYAQFSTDGTNFYSSDGTEGGWDTLSFGDHLSPETAVSLSALNWKGQTSFYYKLKLVSTIDNKTTPIIKKAGLLAIAAQMGTAGEGTAVQLGSDSGYCVPGDTSPCDAPVLHLKMDEKVSGDAKTLYDISGNGNNGTTVDGANNTGMDCAVRGKYGSACEFDGVDDYAGISQSSSINNLTTFTYSAWVKAKEDSGSQNPVIEKGNGSSQRKTMYLTQSTGTNSRRVIFMVDTDSTNALSSSAYYSYTVGQWEHWTATYDDGGDRIIRIYKNGQEVSYSSQTAGTGNLVDDATLNFALGATPGTQFYRFTGQIDDVRIYDYVRTSAQIAWDYNKGKPMAEWRFDESSGATAHNSVSNTLHGTLYNMEDGDWTAGKTNNALDFDGSDEYADIGDTNLNLIAIGFWIFADSATDDIIDFDGGTHTITVSGGEITAGGFSSPTIFVDGMEDATIATGAWHHVFVKTDTAFEVSNMDIGRIGAGYFDGKLDDVKFFNYALTDEQVKMEYTGGAVRFGE